MCVSQGKEVVISPDNEAGEPSQTAALCVFLLSELPYCIPYMSRKLQF
jgi:hypothetical protein